MLFAVLAALQLPLVLNPGYFSHDELQWAARADAANWTALPWESWSDLGVFQYRPLTFNLWLLLSRAFFATPYLMHAVFVALGSVNGLLLGRCIEAAGAPRRIAMAAAAIFVLSPYAVYVHGWVGTLADLLTLLAALTGFCLLQRAGRDSPPRVIAQGFLMIALTCAALLCKESAVVLPVALLPAAYRHPHPRKVLALVALAAVPVAAYLTLRLPVILTTTQGHESYAWAIRHVPNRLAEYFLFPFVPPLFEVSATLAKSGARLSAAAACVAAVLGALASLGWRWPCAWLASISLLLAPVLILPASYAQYAYLASAAAIGIVAVAWPRAAKLPRLALAVAAVICTAHGIAVMARMRTVGLVQHRFHTDLTALLAQGANAPRIALADEGDRWMAERFLQNVPFYHGAHLAEAGESAPLRMLRDGHVVRTEP